PHRCQATGRPLRDGACRHEARVQAAGPAGASGRLRQRTERDPGRRLYGLPQRQGDRAIVGDRGPGGPGLGGGRAPPGVRGRFMGAPSGRRPGGGVGRRTLDHIRRRARDELTSEGKIDLPSDAGKLRDIEPLPPTPGVPLAPEILAPPRLARARSSLTVGGHCMTTSPLAKKLLVKPGHRIALINAPAGYAELLRPLPESAELVDAPGSPVDVVQVFLRDSAELERIGPAAVKAMKPDGL